MANGIWSMAVHQPYAISPQPSAMAKAASPRRRPRPDGALVLAFDDALHPLVDELLQAAPVVGFGRVDVPLRVGGDAVHGVELAEHLAAVAKAAQDLQRLPI